MELLWAKNERGIVKMVHRSLDSNLRCVFFNSCDFSNENCVDALESELRRWWSRRRLVEFFEYSLQLHFDLVTETAPSGRGYDPAAAAVHSLQLYFLLLSSETFRSVHKLWFSRKGPKHTWLLRERLLALVFVALFSSRNKFSAVQHSIAIWAFHLLSQHGVLHFSKNGHRQNTIATEGLLSTSSADVHVAHCARLWMSWMAECIVFLSKMPCHSYFSVIVCGVGFSAEIGMNVILVPNFLPSTRRGPFCFSILFTFAALGCQVSSLRVGSSSCGFGKVYQSAMKFGQNSTSFDSNFSFSTLARWVRCFPTTPVENCAGSCMCCQFLKISPRGESAVSSKFELRGEGSLGRSVDWLWCRKTLTQISIVCWSEAVLAPRSGLTSSWNLQRRRGARVTPVRGSAVQLMVRFALLNGLCDVNDSEPWKEVANRKKGVSDTECTQSWGICWGIEQARKRCLGPYRDAWVWWVAKGLPWSQYEWFL